MGATLSGIPAQAEILRTKVIKPMRSDDPVPAEVLRLKGGLGPDDGELLKLLRLSLLKS